MPSMENVNRWIEQVNIDYYTQYIKAWIPFNAWYKCSYPSLDTDRAIINEIKRTNNTFSDAIRTLISDTSTDGYLFRGYVSDLHKALQNCTIRNGDKIISFAEIIIEKNANSKIDHTYRGTHYYLNREDESGGKCKITIALKRNGTNLFTLTQNNFNIKELTENSSFSSLTLERQRKLRSLYEEINPYKPCNLIQRNLSDGYIEIGDYKFINDINSIVKGIIEILYLIRCSLFHGEVVPNEQASRVYKYSYEILSMLLQRIK